MSEGTTHREAAPEQVQGPAQVQDSAARPPTADLPVPEDATTPPVVPLPAVAAADPVPKKKKKKKTKKKDGPPKSRLGTSRGIETMFRTSYRQHIDLSALADTKANIMISINGIIMSIILASISPKIDANTWLVLPTSVLLIGCLISMVYAILSARPRISSNVVSLEDVRQNRANILFFGNFITMPVDDYLQGMEELLQNTDNLYTNMMRDIYALGKVLKQKFALLRIAYTVFMYSLIISILLFIGVFMYVVITDVGATP